MALNSKRMQTFFNEFLITTTNFLNDFASECEDKFYELERKILRVESNLVIIEAKLASVPTEEKSIPINIPEVSDLSSKSSEPKESQPVETKPEAVPIPIAPEIEQKLEAAEAVNDNQIKISESAVYRKFFKMLKFGIQLLAVQQKMSSEGLDCKLLDNPDLIVVKTPEDYEEEQ